MAYGQWYTSHRRLKPPAIVHCSLFIARWPEAIHINSTSVSRAAHSPSGDSCPTDNGRGWGACRFLLLWMAYGQRFANGALWLSVRSVYLSSCTEEWARRPFPVRGFMSYGQWEGMGDVLFSIAMDGLRPMVRRRLSVPLCGSLWFSVRSVYLFSCTEEWARSPFPVRGFMSYGQRVRMGDVSFSIAMDGLRPTVRGRLSVPLCASLCALCTFLLAQRTRRLHRGTQRNGRGGAHFRKGDLWPMDNGGGRRMLFSMAMNGLRPMVHYSLHNRHPILAETGW
jgi:hypothetical protein